MRILRHASEVRAFRHPVASIMGLLVDRLESLTVEGDAMEDVVFFIVNRLSSLGNPHEC